MTLRERPAVGTIFQPPVFTDAVKNDTAWMLHWLVWSVAGLITLLILLMIPAVGTDAARFAGQALAVDLLCLGMIMLLRRGYIWLAERLLVMGFWLIAIATVWTSGGLNSPAIATFLLAVAYVTLFMGTRQGVVAIIGAAALFAALALLQSAGHFPEPVIVHTYWSRALAMAIYTMILANALILIARTLDRSRRRTETELVERRAAESRLKVLNAELGARVEERTEVLASVIDDLERANVELEAATRAKNDFLAAMSHELRTPLNSVIGFSGTLASGLAGELNDEQQRQVEMIGTSGRILLDLVNQILDLAKIESGDAELDIEELDVATVIGRIEDLTRPLAVERGLELQSDVADGAGVISSDLLRLEQSLLNLVGNAIKFTESGRVGLNARADGDGVVFEVSDTGQGIIPEELSLIFERFYQAVPSTGGKHEGTGLGLALTRQLVDSLGGTIEVSSVVGKGSTFHIHLPRTAPTPE